jgi:TP901 family phage tail tape measure protein
MPGKSLALGLVIGASVGASVGGAFRTVQQQSRRLGQTLKKAKLGAALTGDVIKYKAQLAKLKTQQTKTGASSEALNRKIAAAERNYKKAALRAGKYGIEVGNVARQHRLFQRAVERSERGMGRLERRQRNQQIRGGLKGQAFGLLAGAYAIGRQFSSALGFEGAAVRLKTVLNTDNVGKALIKAREHAIGFARKGLTSETDILGIQYALSSAGFDAAAARAGSTIVAKVATVTRGAPEQVGEVVATVFNNLGDSLAGNTQQKLERIGDLLTKTQFKFQIRDFGQLGESLKYATPTLAQFNMDLAQGVTIMGALNSAGLQGSMAGTAFAATMRNMSKASQGLGFDLVRNEKGQLDFIATMENLSDSIGGFDNLDQDTIDELQKLFGEEGIRGVTLLGKQLGKLRAAQEDVTKGSKGLVDSAYNEFVKSAPGQLKIFGNNLRLLGMTLAGSLLPALNKTLKPMIGYVQTVGKAIQDNPELAKTIMGVVGGVFALKTATVVGKFGITLFSDSAMLLGGALRSLKSGIGLVITVIRLLGVAIMTNPIGFIVGGIALAAGLIIANWDSVKSYFLSVWDQVKPYWDKFANYVGRVWARISAPFKAMSKFGKMIGTSVAEWVVGDESPAKKVAKTTTAAALTSIIAASPVAAGNNATVQVSAPITVQAAPGMNEEQLAEKVAQKLNQVMQKSSRSNDMEWHD